MTSELPEDRIIVPKAARTFCGKCGFFRITGYICLNCCINGEYKTHHVTSKTMRSAVKIALMLPKDHPELELIHHQLLATFPKKKRGVNSKGLTRSQQSAASKRLMRSKQLKLAALIFRLFLKCFERDEVGQWQLYGDQLPNLRPLLDIMQDVEAEIARNTAVWFNEATEEHGSVSAARYFSSFPRKRRIVKG